MTEQERTDFLISTLDLPASCRVDQRVPKKMLIENLSPTPSDKRLLNDAIEEIQWIAALKPNTAGVPEYRDEQREYIEVAVLRITVRGPLYRKSIEDGDGTASIKWHSTILRLAELVHRAVPYPVLLLIDAQRRVLLSLVHKRRAQNEAGKVVLDGDVAIADVGDLPSDHSFFEALSLGHQPQASLFMLYQGWIDCLTALEVSCLTGTFQIARAPGQGADRRVMLRECLRLSQEIVRLRAMASKEKQMAKVVDLNLALKRVHADLIATQQRLKECT